MSIQGQPAQAAPPAYRIERIIASLVMAWVIILTTYMIFQDHALSHESMYFLKIILSLSGAVMLATLPGFMDVNYSVGGFSVRAAGGAAAFVFIYTQSPNLPALKLDPAHAKPVQQAPLPKSAELTQLTNDYPMLMTFSLIAPGLIYSSYSGSEGGGFEGGVDVTSDNGSSSVTGSLGSVSLGEAISSDTAAVMHTVSTYVYAAGRQLVALLDGAAATLRGGVSRVASIIGDLLGTANGGGSTKETLAMITETLSARADAIVLGLVGSDEDREAFLNQVGGLTSGLAGHLQDTADGVVSTTDRTVQGLTSGLQGTVHTVLDGTGDLTESVTGLLDNATGNLTSGLTPTADRIVSGIASTTEQIVDSVTPALASTTSQALAGMGHAMDNVTDHLNALSPAVIAKLDPDFAAGQPLQLAEKLETATSLPALDTLADPLGKFGHEDQHGLLGAAGSRNLFADKAFDHSGGDTLSAGPTCLGGCGGKLLSGPGAPLGNAGGALAIGSGPLLGPAIGGTSSLGGGGPGGSDAGPAGSSTPTSGPVSSAIGRTNSILGGATKLIGRR